MIVRRGMFGNEFCSAWAGKLGSGCIESVDIAAPR